MSDSGATFGRIALADSKDNLISVARAVAKELKGRSEGTRLKIRIPSSAFKTNTDGWGVIVGRFGTKRVHLQVWLDRYSRHSNRKLYAAFWSDSKQEILKITRRVSRKLRPVRRLTEKDIESHGNHQVLKKRLPRAEFNAPILEMYQTDKSFFYGFFFSIPEATATERRAFTAQASDFFEEVARVLPQTKPADRDRDVYPQCENRQYVTTHLRRERSSLLATQRKIKDKYRCQVCNLLFTEMYGERGLEFAEAHHLDALSSLRGPVKNDLNDLATVCPNCHSMLHKMSGKRGDVSRLRAIVRKHRAKHK